MHDVFHNYQRPFLHSRSAGVLFTPTLPPLFIDENGRADFYDIVISELKKYPGLLTECQSHAGLPRKIPNLHESLRGTLDLKAVQLLSYYVHRPQPPTLFFFGSGKLLSELTVIAVLMSIGISPRIVLIDDTYRKDTKELGQKNSAELAALNAFLEIIYNLSIRFRVRHDVRIFSDLNISLNTFIRTGEKITAFFMIDSYFPVSFGLNKFKESVDVAFRNAIPLKYAPLTQFSYKCLFFILAGEPSLQPSAKISEMAALSIFDVLMNHHGCARTDLIYEQFADI